MDHFPLPVKAWYTPQRESHDPLNDPLNFSLFHRSDWAVFFIPSGNLPRPAVAFLWRRLVAIRWTGLTVKLSCPTGSLEETPRKSHHASAVVPRYDLFRKDSQPSFLLGNCLLLHASEKRTHNSANEASGQESCPHQTIRLSHKQNEEANDMPAIIPHPPAAKGTRIGLTLRS